MQVEGRVRVTLPFGTQVTSVSADNSLGERLETVKRSGSPEAL